MLDWFMDRYSELTDPNHYRLRGVSTLWAVRCAALVRGTIWFVAVYALSLALFQITSCTPGEALRALSGVAKLAQAAADMHDVASEASEQPSEAESQEILEEQLPEVLQAMDEALAEMCAPEGLLEPEDKVCRHYRAYKADPTE